MRLCEAIENYYHQVYVVPHQKKDKLIKTQTYQQKNKNIHLKTLFATL